MGRIEGLDRLCAAMKCGGLDPILRDCLHECLEESWPDNHLAPGGRPLEVSFSEATPHLLRLDAAVGGPGASPRHRRDLCFALVGNKQEAWRRLEAYWREAPQIAYGAVLGLVRSPEGEEQRKIYLECIPGMPLPSPWGEMAQRA